MSGSTNSSASIADAYFDAWTRNDIERVRPLLHDDVDFLGALGTTRGVKETLTGLGAPGLRCPSMSRWSAAGSTALTC